jgi:hypothetical protein
MTKLWYLASPYSHEEEYMMEERFKAVARVAGRLALRGVFTFCPIAHTHPIAVEMGKGPSTSLSGTPSQTDHEFWMVWDKIMAPKCDGLIVCMFPGWERSKGVGIEVPLFRKLGKPVQHLDPRPYFDNGEWRVLAEDEGV